MTPITNPYPLFSDTLSRLIDGARIYIGQPDQDPELYPKDVFWDAAMTIPAMQPLRTVAGYVVNNGTPAQPFVEGAYSIRVRQANGAVVYSQPRVLDNLSSFIATLSNPDGAEQIGFGTRSVDSKLRETVSVTDTRFAGGAKGDGVTDDTAAFNAAIATGKAVVVPLPPVAYSVAEINVVNGMYVAGEKIGASDSTPMLWVRTAGKAAFFNNSTTNVFNVTLENLACNAAPGIMDARFYDQATSTFYSAYFTFRDIETYLSLSIGYKGLFIYTTWENPRDGYYGSPTNTSHIAIQALAGSYGQTNRQNINRIANPRFFSSFGGQGAIVCSYGTKWLIEGGGFEAIKTAAFRGYNTTQVEFEGVWFEGIEANAIIALSDLGGDFSSATISRCTFVLTNPAPRFAVTIESGTVAFRTSVFNLVPAGMRQINNGARVTVNDGCIVDGAGAANFMDGAFADIAIGGRRRLNGATDNNVTGMTMQNAGGIAATSGFLSADNIAVGTSFVTVATSATGLGGTCVISGSDPVGGLQFRVVKDWQGATVRDVVAPLNATGKVFSFQVVGNALQMKVDVGSVLVFTTLLN